MAQAKTPEILTLDDHGNLVPVATGKKLDAQYRATNVDDYVSKYAEEVYVSQQGGPYKGEDTGAKGGTDYGGQGGYQTEGATYTPNYGPADDYIDSSSSSGGFFSGLSSANTQTDSGGSGDTVQ